MTDFEKKVLHEAVVAAINKIGLDAFKRTSLFLAGRRNLGGS